MFGRQIQMMTAPFEAQFETAGADVFYRKYGKGPPIRIDVTERDTFVASFTRWVWWTYLAVIAAMLIGAGLLVAYYVLSDREPRGYVMYVGVAVIAGLFLVGNRWAFNAPARALQYRLPSGAPLSPDDIRRRLFERLTWGRLAGGAVMAVLMPLGARHTDVLHGWGRLWLAASAGLLVLVMVQAFRKWRYETALKRAVNAGA